MILLLLHGFNQSAASFQTAFNTHFDSSRLVPQISIDAPWQNTTNPGGMAHSWFDYDTNDQATKWSAGRKRVQATFALTKRLDPDIVLVGFSQGASMAIEAAFSARQQVQCVLAIQGYPLPETLHKTNNNRHTVIWAVLCAEDGIVEADTALFHFRMLRKFHSNLHIHIFMHRQCRHGDFATIDRDLTTNFLASCKAADRQNSTLNVHDSD